MAVLPGRDRRNAPAAKGAPIVGQIKGEERIAFLEPGRADLERIIPPMPEIAGPKLSSLPAQVGFFLLADLVSAIAEELRIPFGQAKFPGHPRAAEFPLALVPSAVH